MWPQSWFLRAYLLVGTRRGRVITFQAVIWRDPGVGPAADGPGMGIYDFEVLKDDTVIAAKQAIALPDARAAWPKVAELAKTFNEPGHKIRVRDEAGGIVMLIGVVALRHSANAVSTGVLGVSGSISEVR
jgi:hypothetical protein